MLLDKFILNIWLIFIVVPEIILLKLGFEPEEMNIIPFLFVWIFLIAAIFLLIKAIFRIAQLHLNRNS